MRVEAQLKKESIFSSLTLFSVSLLVNKWMTLGNQVFMIRSSVLLHSRAILFCRLLQSTGPEALNQEKPKSNKKKETRKSSCEISLRKQWHVGVLSYLHPERSARTSGENVM